MEISEIPVTDNRGRRIGKARLEKDETGIKAHMILDSDVGHMLLYGMRDNMIQGLSIAPVIEPAFPEPAPRPRLIERVGGGPYPLPPQYQQGIEFNRWGVGYIPPGMARDWPIIGRARIDVDEHGVIARFEFVAEPKD